MGNNIATGPGVASLLVSLPVLMEALLKNPHQGRLWWLTGKGVILQLGVMFFPLQGSVYNNALLARP